MLTSPIRDGDGDRRRRLPGGDDRHPDWLLNLRAEPNVEVALRNGPRRPMTAHVADAAERERLWKEITASHPRYAAYQRRTSREIPVVLLRRRQLEPDRLDVRVGQASARSTSLIVRQDTGHHPHRRLRCVAALTCFPNRL